MLYQRLAFVDELDKSGEVRGQNFLHVCVDLRLLQLPEAGALFGVSGDLSLKVQLDVIPIYKLTSRTVRMTS